MTSQDETSRALLLVADDLDGRGYPLTGVLRRAARMLLRGEHREPDDGCRGCGAPLAQPPRGRRRVWCSERCRRPFRP